MDGHAIAGEVGMQLSIAKRTHIRRDLGLSWPRVCLILCVADKHIEQGRLYAMVRSMARPYGTFDCAALLIALRNRQIQ